MQTPGLTNNFDLIRLLASVQVFMIHVYLIGFFPDNAVVDMIRFLPGVPIFFGMSGFLLIWSLERNDETVAYLKNRFLRLFPALWATMILTAFLLIALKTISFHQLSESGPLLYLIGRCSIIYVFTPEVVRSFGNLNNPNGSLWTIGVELQFYLLLPFLYRLIRRRSRLFKNITLIILATISYAIDRTDANPPFNVASLNGYLQILISECRIFYYLFFFIIGMLFYINYDRLRAFLEDRFLVNLIGYAVFCGLSYHHSNRSVADLYAPDPLSLVRHIALMFVVFSAAFSNIRLTDLLLKGNDYSYGIYLTHLLILNACWQLHLPSPVLAVTIAAVVTVLLAWLSWHGIEKKFLLLKKHSLRHQIRRTAGAISGTILAKNNI